jgi:predicted outer membrane repeat protein
LLLSLNHAAHGIPVQACQSDNQQGAGTNLQQAIAAGGVVTFECPSATTIEVRLGHLITRPVTIVGDGRITLQIESGPAFIVSGPGGSLGFNGVHIVGGTTPRPVRARILPQVLFLVIQAGALKMENTIVETFREPLGSVVAGGTLELLSNTRIRAISGGLTLHDSTLSVSNTSLEDWSQPLELVGGNASLKETQINRAKLRLRNCVLDIAEVQFSQNDVQARRENGGALETDCVGTITRTTFSFNKAVSGGALYVPGGQPGKLTISQVRFEHNEAIEHGGGADITAGRGGLSGLLPEQRGRRGLEVELLYSTFIGNTAAEGGGLYGTGVDLRAARFKSNVAKQRGGGLFVNGGGSTRRASFVSNRALAVGGGLLAINTSFANALVVRNEAPRGAGIFGANTDLINVTIADNIGGGLDASLFVDGFRLKNTLVVNNAGGNCATGGTAQTFSASMQFPGSSCGSEMTTRDPYLDSMYAPVAGSPARSGGDLQTCLAAPVSGRDFYGEPRPQGSSCSIGAVEGAIDRLVYRRLRDPGEVPSDLLRAMNERLRQLLGQR